MKRRIIKQGAGYTVTLPVDWIRKYGLSTGDELDIEHRGKSIILDHDKSKIVEDVNLVLNGNKNQIINSLIAAYRNGAGMPPPRCGGVYLGT